MSAVGPSIFLHQSCLKVINSLIFDTILLISTGVIFIYQFFRAQPWKQWVCQPAGVVEPRMSEFTAILPIGCMFDRASFCGCYACGFFHWSFGRSYKVFCPIVCGNQNTKSDIASQVPPINKTMHTRDSTNQNKIKAGNPRVSREPQIEISFYTHKNQVQTTTYKLKTKEKQRIPKKQMPTGRAHHI